MNDSSRHWSSGAAALLLTACTVATPADPVAPLHGAPVWEKPDSGCQRWAAAYTTKCALCAMERPEDCRQKCDSGDAHACFLSGFSLELGVVPRRDAVRAHRYYVRACNLGSFEACEGLARQQMTGEGIAQDASAALAMFLRLCDARYGPACTWAAKAYLARGAASDLALVTDLFERGCPTGSPEGCRLLAERDAPPTKP